MYVLGCRYKEGKVIELLHEPAYRHVLFNHVPIIGLMLSCVVLLAGLGMRQVVVLRLGLLMIAATDDY